MTAYSDGPWRMHDELILSGGTGRQGQIVCEAPGQFHWDTEPEKLANGHLIASAPSLLAACDLIRPWMSKAMADNVFANVVRPSAARHAFEMLIEATALAYGFSNPIEWAKKL